uniref:Adipose-secreted signaling protein n=1 Tax=Coturnix japonica TaxID=93934 RepID=A0A8C2T4L8_COTJA
MLIVLIEGDGNCADGGRRWGVGAAGRVGGNGNKLHPGGSGWTLGTCIYCEGGPTGGASSWTMPSVPSAHPWGLRGALTCWEEHPSAKCCVVTAVLDRLHQGEEHRRGLHRRGLHTGDPHGSWVSDVPEVPVGIWSLAWGYRGAERAQGLHSTRGCSMGAVQGLITIMVLCFLPRGHEIQQHGAQSMGENTAAMRLQLAEREQALLLAQETVQVGFLKILHKYEISFLLPPSQRLQGDVCALPLPNPNLRVLAVTAGPEGYSVRCEYTAHKEGVLKEEMLLASETGDGSCVKVVVQARVMDRHHGTPMLLDGVRCVGAELEYDSEQSDWHGFD